MKKLTLFYALFATFALCSCEANSAIKLNPIIDGVEIHTEHQKAFLEDTNPSNIGKYAAYASLEGYANPVPVSFSWKNGKAPFTFDIYEFDNPSNEYIIKTNSRKLDLYNLKVNTKYVWKVVGANEEDRNAAATNEFTTCETILRNINADIDNFRDLGGYLTSNGKRVKQGLIYRSAEINKNKDMSGTVLANKEGLDVLNNQLKIKTEIDLRKNEIVDGVNEKGGIEKSPISDSVTYLNLPMYYDGENMLAHSDESKNATNLASIKSFFETLMDEKNYPIVFHCVQGKDRTGMLAYILNALLGVSKDDLYRDYLFTNFSHSVGSACKTNDIDTRYGLTINRCEGETLQEKTRNMLKSTFDFTDEDLNKITNILL